MHFFRHQSTPTDRAAAPRLFIAAIVAAVACLTAAPSSAQISKGHRILIERGLQTQGMVTRDDVFHLSTYQDANYSTINWLWNSNPSQHGPAPGYPWSRWVGNENEMPAGEELPYLDQLVSLQLGDEWNLNDPALRDRAVAWFDSIRQQWPDTILYMNNFGGQVSDAALGDFIARARPDMLSFDTYPFKSDYILRTPNAPAHGSPAQWYGDLRRYRVYAHNFGLPLAIYRQTFHAVQDYDQTVYRDPSPSEMNLNTFGAMAFGATTFIDFTYNTGASSLFTTPGGDSNPTAAYQQQAEINRRARNLGKTLVHLVGKDAPPDGGQPTRDIMFIRGKTGPLATDVTPLPIGFVPDNALPNSFSEWENQRNDPYISGWVVTNLGTKNEGRPGDVILSWFKPLDASLDKPTDVDDQIYFMVVNGLTGPDGTAADYRQRIQINFFQAAGNFVQRLNSDTGQVEDVPLEPIPGSSRKRLVLELDGGMGELFKFKTGDPFIGGQAAADFDLDGDVDGGDFLTWQRGHGRTNAGRAHGDATFDGAVDANDLDAWARQFSSQSTPLAAIPEPSAAILLACAAPLILAFRLLAS